jgi:hypothetical protein
VRAMGTSERKVGGGVEKLAQGGVDSVAADVYHGI